MENFKIEVDSDGVALVTFDVPGRSMNTLTASVIKEVGEVLPQRLRVLRTEIDLPLLAVNAEVDGLVRRGPVQVIDEAHFTNLGHAWAP